MRFSSDGTFASRASMRRKSGLAVPASQWLRDTAGWATDVAFDQQTAPGGAISSWVGDVSNTFVQATAGKQPTASTTSFHNNLGTAQEGVVFDGVDDCMTLGTLSANLPSGANASMLYFIVNQTATVDDTTTRTLFSYGGTTAGTYRAIERRVVDGVNRVVLTDGAADLVDDQVDFSGVHFIRAWFTGTTWGFDLNGSPLQGGSLVPNTGTTIACLGINTAQNGGTWKGEIAQFMLTGGTVSNWTDARIQAGLVDVTRYYYRQ